MENKKKTDKYVHNTIQNEMMKIMALQVLREVAQNIQSADFYSLMGDEATDVSNVLQLVICLRWVDCDLVAHDEFIGLKDMPCTNADSIVAELTDVLLQMNLKLKACVRYFLSNFYFLPNDNPSKNMKNVFYFI